MPENITILITVKHNNKEHGGYVEIPPEKQNMEYIREQCNNLAWAAAQRIKKSILNDSLE